MFTLIFDNVSKSYHRGENAINALNSISLGFTKGSMSAIAGPSGSGKSTLLRIAGLLDFCDSGHVSVAGTKISNTTSESELIVIRRKQIGFVFQSFELVNYLTAIENVALVLELNGLSKAQSGIQARETLINLGLGDRLHHFPEQLSGGQMQRVALARALVKKPALILADEPTGNLDSQSGNLVLNHLRKAAQQGITVLVATHSEEVINECDQVIYLHDGILKAQYHKKPAEVHQPNSESL